MKIGKPKSNSLEAYLEFYGNDLGRLEWSKHEAERRIREYHRRQLAEEKKKTQRRAERVYTSLSKLLKLDYAKIDTYDDEELDRYIFNRMFTVFNEAQMKKVEILQNETSGATDALSPPQERTELVRDLSLPT